MNLWAATPPRTELLAMAACCNLGSGPRDAEMQTDAIALVGPIEFLHRTSSEGRPYFILFTPRAGWQA